jgi:hypothetical protein
MSCLGAIVKLFLGLVAGAVLLVVAALVLAGIQSGRQAGSSTQESVHHSGAGKSQNASNEIAAPTPPPPPPSLEERIEREQGELIDLRLKAKEALESALSSSAPDAALRQITLSFETIVDGPEGANSVAKRLTEELNGIREKTKSVRANARLSQGDKNELTRTLAAQEAAVQRTLGQARKFCDELRSIQTKEIPSWTSAYSHFVTVLGASEALNKIAPRIRAAANRLGPAR